VYTITYLVFTRYAGKNGENFQKNFVGEQFSVGPFLRLPEKAPLLKKFGRNITEKRLTTKPEGPNNRGV